MGLGQLMPDSGGPCDTARSGYAERPTLTMQLAQKRAQLKEELERVETALQALEENPQVANVVDAIAKLRM